MLTGMKTISVVCGSIDLVAVGFIFLFLLEGGLGTLGVVQSRHLAKHSSSAISRLFLIIVACFSSGMEASLRITGIGKAAAQNGCKSRL
jgi:hypothetical protein